MNNEYEIHMKANEAPGLTIPSISALMKLPA